MPFWTNMYISWPHTFANDLKVYWIRQQANLVYSMSSWTKLPLNDLETVLSCIFHMWPLRPISILMSIISLWFTLLSFTLQHTWLVLLTQFWSYIKLLKSCASFNYWHEQVSFTDCTYLHYIYETESRPSLSLPVMHKVLSSHSMFSKSDYILKALSMCIDYIFKMQSMFIKNYSVL